MMNTKYIWKSGSIRNAHEFFFSDVERLILGFFTHKL
jgi:hypothetical protein